MSAECSRRSVGRGRVLSSLLALLILTGLLGYALGYSAGRAANFILG
jgi:hypothetical protein